MSAAPPDLVGAVGALRQAVAIQCEIAGPVRFLDLPVRDRVRNRASTSSSTVASSTLTIDDTRASGLLEPDAPGHRLEALIPPDSPVKEMRTMAEIRAWMDDSILIPIDANRKNLVLGVGPEDADVMVIGEAPGADEDAQGEPFVGRAGQLLNKILAAVEFDRDDVYITNILKSRPPNNRNPQPDEVEAHMPVLYKQIALIQPRLILAVGRSAATALLDTNASLSALRGTFHDFHGIPLMVTYHPAALLRNPQWKRPTWEDVQRFREKYDNLNENAAN